ARTKQINSWYQLYLNRTPDLGGLNTFLNFTLTQSYATAQAIIAASQEAYNDAGGTNPGYVTYLYQKILGRTAAQVDVNGWVVALNAGIVSRAQVASAFLLSAEYTNDVVDAFYMAYQPGGLSTPPADDLQAMGMDLRSGHTEINVLTQLLTANGDY